MHIRPYQFFILRLLNIEVDWAINARNDHIKELSIQQGSTCCGGCVGMEEYGRLIMHVCVCVCVCVCVYVCECVPYLEGEATWFEVDRQQR